MKLYVYTKQRTAIILSAVKVNVTEMWMWSLLERNITHIPIPSYICSVVFQFCTDGQTHGQKETITVSHNTAGWQVHSRRGDVRLWPSHCYYAVDWEPTLSLSR